ncbi:MAG: arsenite methyltransferase [Armatimonadota bacterium]|nr:arsenite methyltransferase [Armatimonadota bacterium]MDW8104720.1 arsenite methyltransferase [Armatimonadota bacterium]
MVGNRIDPSTIREAVRDQYGRIARQAAQGAGCCISSISCCEDACVEDPTQLGYSPEDLAQIPREAAGISLGCGAPVKIANIQPGEVVLDLGCGGGMDVLLAARLVGPSGMVYGLDMTEEMIALATRNAEKLGVTNVRFLWGEIEAIPLPDASVDVVISNCVLNLVPDKARAFREIWRVLKPGGRLAESDIVVDGGFDDLPIPEEQIRNALSWTGCVAGALSTEDYRQMLEEAGFKQIHITIKYRYLRDDLSQLPGTLRALTEEQQRALLSRICSADITAVKG